MTEHEKLINTLSRVKVQIADKPLSVEDVPRLDSEECRKRAKCIHGLIDERTREVYAVGRAALIRIIDISGIFESTLDADHRHALTSLAVDYVRIMVSSAYAAPYPTVDMANALKAVKSMISQGQNGWNSATEFFNDIDNQLKLLFI